MNGFMLKYLVKLLIFLLWFFFLLGGSSSHDSRLQLTIMDEDDD